MSPEFKKNLFYFSSLFLLPIVLAFVLYMRFDFYNPPIYSSIFFAWFFYLLFKTVRSFINFERPATKSDLLRDSFVLVYSLEYIFSLISAYDPVHDNFRFPGIDGGHVVAFLEGFWENVIPFTSFNVFTLFIPSLVLGMFIYFLIKSTRSIQSA